MTCLQAGVLAVSVPVGGQPGSRFGAKTFDQPVVRRIKAVVVLVPGLTLE